MFRELKIDIRVVFKLTGQRYTRQVEIWIFKTEEFLLLSLNFHLFKRKNTDGISPSVDNT